MINLFYNYFTNFYSNVVSFYENILLKHTKNNNFKLYINNFSKVFLENINKVNFDNFKVIKVNKYLEKVIFPKNDIEKIINNIFIENDLKRILTEYTGFNYNISFFTAYNTYPISHNDSQQAWFANHFHRDKPYSKNMIKVIFSFEEISENDGPMEILTDYKKNNVYKATMSKNEILLFLPNLCLHRAGNPMNKRRFQMMFQLNPSRFWSISSKIYSLQFKREPKFPLFSYFGINKVLFKKLFSQNSLNQH